MPKSQHLKSLEYRLLYFLFLFPRLQPTALRHAIIFRSIHGVKIRFASDATWMMGLRTTGPGLLARSPSEADYPLVTLRGCSGATNYLPSEERRLGRAPRLRAAKSIEAPRGGCGASSHRTTWSQPWIARAWGSGRSWQQQTAPYRSSRCSSRSWRCWSLRLQVARQMRRARAPHASACRRR